MAENLHATALVVGDRGLLVTGASGSGKTILALMLVDRARRRGGHGAFVSDDRVLLEQAGGRIVARAPATIAGLAEYRGPGPLPVGHVGDSVIDGMVELVAAGHAPRLEDQPRKSLLDVSLARLRLASGDPAAAAIAVEAWIANGFQVAG